jgi:hypothetical protein
MNYQSPHRLTGGRTHPAIKELIDKSHRFIHGRSFAFFNFLVTGPVQ